MAATWLALWGNSAGFTARWGGSVGFEWTPGTVPTTPTNAMAWGTDVLTWSGEPIIWG